MPLKGVLFDMDGVIVDNHPYHVEAWIAFCAKHGVTLGEEEYKENVNGRTIGDVIQYVFRNRNMAMEEAREFGAEKEAMYRKAYADHIAPVKGLVNLLDNLKAAGIPFAVATSAPTENVVFTMEGTKLGHYFDTIVDSTGVTKGKPDPEIYLKAAHSIGVSAADCVVFEDALLGIQAGKGAGSKVVGLATTHTAPELEGHVDLTIADFEGLTLEQLEQLF